MSKEPKPSQASTRAGAGKFFSDKIPLTFQLSQLLRDQILSGELTGGNRIPAEVDLAKDFGVSVVTVQRAMRDLSAAGLITRHRRRGTFVADNRAAHVQPQQSDALSLMFSDKFGTDTKILSRKIVPRPDNLDGTFPNHGRLLHIRRLVLRDGSPWSYASIFLLPEFDRSIKPSMIKRYPMFRLLREKLGLRFSNVNIRLQARSAGVEIGNWLSVNPLAPVTVLNAVLFDSDDRAVNAIEIHYRGDQFLFELNMDLKRNPS